MVFFPWLAIMSVYLQLPSLTIVLWALQLTRLQLHRRLSNFNRGRGEKVKCLGFQNLTYSFPISFNLVRTNYSHYLNLKVTWEKLKLRTQWWLPNHTGRLCNNQPTDNWLIEQGGLLKKNKLHKYQYVAFRTHPLLSISSILPHGISQVMQLRPFYHLEVLHNLLFLDLCLNNFAIC